MIFFGGLRRTVESGQRSDFSGQRGGSVKLGKMVAIM